MYIDVNIKVLDRESRLAEILYLDGNLGSDQIAQVPVDEDYIEDFDDVITSIEEELYNRYNVVARYEMHFILTKKEAARICELIDPAQ